jgi:hypothetical protein
MPDVTGVFQHSRGAERAVQYVRDMGIDPADISVFSYDPDATPAPHPDPTQGATAGAGAGGILGGVGGALAGMGLVAIPGAGPLVASGWLVATVTGAVAGGATGGAAGGALAALMSKGFADPEAIDRELKGGATVVRVSVPDDRFHTVSDTFQKFAKI